MSKYKLIGAVEIKYCGCGNVLVTDQEQRDEICRDCI